MPTYFESCGFLGLWKKELDTSKFDGEFAKLSEEGKCSPIGPETVCGPDTELQTKSDGTNVCQITEQFVKALQYQSCH